MLALALAVLAAVPATAAINPDEYKRIASHVLHLREIARVIGTDSASDPTMKRVTVVAEVVQALRRSDDRAKPGAVIVIDYTVDLAALKAARKTFDARGTVPGPQFLQEPEPPELDANREFVAYLAPVAGRLGNVNRYAGARVDFNAAHFSGPVFVPVAAQYSFANP